MLEGTVLEDLQHAVSSLPKDGLKGAKVLVTGGAGFMGSWLCDAMSILGARISCVDNLSSGLLENIQHLVNREGFRFLNKDVSELDLGSEGAELVLHLASRASPEDYQQHPIETLAGNSLGSYRVLEMARRSDATVLFASSSEIYGDAHVIPTPEGYWGNVNPVGPRSSYDEGKRFGEALFMAYHRQYGLDARIVRMFNCYGPRLRAEGAYARAVSRFIMQALKGEEITVFGDGGQTRAFCYVSDAISCLLKVATDERARGEVFNVGNPLETTIIELARMIKEVTGSRSRIAFGPLPAEDPKRRLPDITKARKALGWEPRVCLEEGLRRTIKWFREVKGIGA